MTNSTEISLKSSPKIRKLLNFRNANLQPKIPGEIIKRTEIPGNKLSKIKGTRLPSFREIAGNAVPFAGGTFWKFKPEFLVEWKAPCNPYTELLRVNASTWIIFRNYYFPLKWTYFIHLGSNDSHFYVCFRRTRWNQRVAYHNLTHGA